MGRNLLVTVKQVTVIFFKTNNPEDT